MTARQSGSKKVAALRKRAEKPLRESGTAARPIPKDDVLELIHELEVHQVELDMQNEELRRSHSEIEQARKKYFDLYDLAPVGYVSLDRNGCIREINLTGALIIGQSRRELIGSRFARVVEPARRHLFHQFCRRLFESGKRGNVELKLCPPGNAMRPAVLSGVAIQDEGGKLKLCQVAITDIAARVAAENWRQKLIDTTQDGVVAIDSRAQIVLFNSAAEKIFGYSATEIIGEKVNRLMAEPHQHKHDGYMARYERTGKRRAIGKILEAEGRRKNGETFPIELSVTEIAAGDEPRYAAFIRDVSEKARLQTDMIEHARLAAVGETSAKVAHEVANPLHGIAMGVELIARQLPPDTAPIVQTSLERIARELSRMKRMLLDFRDLSREPKYTRRPVSLNAIVGAVCALQESVCESQGIDLVADVEPDLPLIFADDDRIRQVLLNLLKNAEEAMTGGGVLTVRGERSGNCVKIEVHDTGCGIPADVDVFRPFESDKVGGSGLGLVIARQFVAAHGGTLTYTSTVGEGTSFFLSLPVLPTNPASATST